MNFQTKFKTKLGLIICLNAYETVGVKGHITVKNVIQFQGKPLKYVKKFSHMLYYYVCKLSFSKGKMIM